MEIKLNKEQDDVVKFYLNEKFKEETDDTCEAKTKELRQYNHDALYYGILQANDGQYESPQEHILCIEKNAEQYGVVHKSRDTDEAWSARNIVATSLTPDTMKKFNYENNHSTNSVPMLPQDCCWWNCIPHPVESDRTLMGTTVRT